jgi:Cd2+/Zn2+-exporting ATPase
MAEKTYLLAGLCCPNCAAKIEKRIRSLEGVRTAAIDFAAQKLRIEAHGPDAWERIASGARTIIKDIEPEVEVRDLSAPPAPEERGSGGILRRVPHILLGAGIALFALGMLSVGFPPAFFIGSYLLVGWPVLLKSFRNILKGDIFDENFLMSIATIGAFALGEYAEAAAVMIFYRIGEAFQEAAVNRSRKSITALMDIRPDYANLKTAGGIERVAPETVRLDDLIVVKPGEKIPLDGTVSEGVSALDTSALTGEALPLDVEPGSAVLSGSINKSGLLTVTVTKTFSESTVSKILDLVQNAGSRKSSVENFITKFARYYTPAVVFMALALALVPPLVIPEAGFSEWIHRALVFLVVSCPCALVISIPLSFFGGIGGASRRGILIKGSNYLEALHSVDTVVFDKTGTLTKGTFTVTRIEKVAEGFSEEEILFYAAHAEAHSSHPIALSIRRAYEKGGKSVESGAIGSCTESAGKGVSVLINGASVLAGNRVFLEGAGIPVPAAETAGTVVYLAVRGALAGYLVITDELKPDSLGAARELRDLGVRRIALFTGDTDASARDVAGKAGIDTVYAELLPHQKVECLEALFTDKGKGVLVFAGDGINDAPVLARSDVGVAMGGIGSDAAREAADIVLMTDEPSKIAEGIRIARKTRRIVRQNIVFALAVKGCVLVLGALGVATMWEAVFGAVGVAVIAILNAIRAASGAAGGGGTPSPTAS